MTCLFSEMVLTSVTIVVLYMLRSLFQRFVVRSGTRNLVPVPVEVPDTDFQPLSDASTANERLREEPLSVNTFVNRNFVEV